MTRRSWFATIIAAIVGQKAAPASPPTPKWVTPTAEWYFSHAPRFEFGVTGFKENLANLNGLLEWVETDIRAASRGISREAV